LAQPAAETPPGAGSSSIRASHTGPAWWLKNSGRNSVHARASSLCAQAQAFMRVAAAARREPTVQVHAAHREQPAEPEGGMKDQLAGIERQAAAEGHAKGRAGRRTEVQQVQKEKVPGGRPAAGNCPPACS
jgi:hypothetical protein